MKLTRRQLLAAMAAAAAVPRRAQASSASDRRFIFVYTMGGWDVTRVFAPLLGLATVNTEADAALATVGNLTYVDHPARPSVRSFFERHHDKVCVVNGVYCPSISHSGALKTTWTARPDASTADWPTRIAAAQAEKFIVPYLVVGGPYFAGESGVYVCRAGSANQLSGLVTGEALDDADTPMPAPPPTTLSAIDAWLLSEGDRRSADADTARAKVATTYTIAQGRAGELKALGDSIDLTSGSALSEQLDLGVRALSSGLSRVVSLMHPRQNSLTAWDSHAINDLTQTELFESLFSDLSSLMAKLAAATGPDGGSLADTTTVVVMSEMGRTPTLNASAGKDHWPYTSVMYIGGGFTGDRVVGSFDDEQYGNPVDLTTGEDSAKGDLLSVDIMGATLLRMGDVDPAAEGIDASAVEGLLA
ncbi:hypothetical protein LBMAG42_05090 [Deltaproteobacteria bacterium]|nr:hypothetical protein LBMAG42_05090 [Deltaproteobacteria bacterium]